jgi:uncharacterized protein
MPASRLTLARPFDALSRDCPDESMADSGRAGEWLDVAQRGALVMLRLYKLLLSPMFAGSCRFLPSCSDYARDAVTTHGVMKGTWLAVRRLSRCHPFGSSGYDPVPGRESRV